MNFAIGSGASSTDVARIKTEYSAGFQVGLSIHTYNSGFAERVRIDAGGNVGIGCTSPDHKLSVSDTSSGLVTQAIFGQDKTSGQSQIVIGEQDASDKSLNIGFDHANSYGYMQVSGSDIGSGIVITNTESKKVGVGTTSPDTKLHVNGAITLGAAGGPQIISGTPAPTVSAPNGSLYLRTDGTGPNLYVRQNGGWVSK